MPDVWLGRFSRWIEKLVNAKGGPILVDVNPTVQVTNALNSGNEERYLQGWERFAFRFSQAAVAAQFGELQIRMPLGQTVAVIEKVTVEFAAAGTWLVFEVTSTVDLASVQTPTFQRWDRRGRPVGTAVLSQTTVAALPANVPFSAMVGAITTSTDLIQTINQELTVLPGDAFALVFNQANTTASASIWWRERPLESSEFN